MSAQPEGLEELSDVGTIFSDALKGDGFTYHGAAAKATAVVFALKDLRAAFDSIATVIQGAYLNGQLPPISDAELAEKIITEYGRKRASAYEQGKRADGIEAKLQVARDALVNFSKRQCGSDCKNRYTEKTVATGVDPQSVWCAACLSGSILAAL